VHGRNAKKTRWSACRGTTLLLSVAAFSLVSATAARAQNSTSPPPAPPAAAKPSAKPAAQPPADSNAFPEAQSEAAQKQAEASDKAASDGPAATLGDTEPESSSRARMKGVDLLGDHDARTSDGAGNTIHDPKLGKEDVRVGQLYMGEEDYPGAYSRFKEATQVSPENLDAVFFLAEAARKTTHLDEAAANYKLYLDAEPRGKHAKDALKALAQLAGK
jgi:cytochrome c-type biogenesis protein CcmH/NrfG